MSMAKVQGPGYSAVQNSVIKIAVITGTKHINIQPVWPSYTLPQHCSTNANLLLKIINFQLACSHVPPPQMQH